MAAADRRHRGGLRSYRTGVPVRPLQLRCPGLPGLWQGQLRHPAQAGSQHQRLPEISPLGENLLLKVASFITDPVTTTDELIPSGETSSYRSNPLGLAEFTLSRKDPAYVGRAKPSVGGGCPRAGQGDASLLDKIHAVPGCEALTLGGCTAGFHHLCGQARRWFRPGASSLLASVCWAPEQTSCPSMPPSATART